MNTINRYRSVSSVAQPQARPQQAARPVITSGVAGAQYPFVSAQQFLGARGLPFQLAKSVQFGRAYGGYEPALDEAELRAVLDRRKYIKFDFDPSVFDTLSKGYKEALPHAIRAAQAIDHAFLRQEHPENLKVRTALAEAAQNGDSFAQGLLALFDIFKGPECFDPTLERQTDQGLKVGGHVRLFEDLALEEGKNDYPAGLTVEELIRQVKLLLAENQIETVRNIFRNNTVVRWEGKGESRRLKAVPYKVEFKEELETAARELRQAGQKSGDPHFKEYMDAVATALLSEDEEDMARSNQLMVDYDGPVEVTLANEIYRDRLTGALSTALTQDTELATLLESHNIKLKTKIGLGIKVSIRNTDPAILAEFARYQEGLKAFSQRMPFMQETPYGQGVDDVQKLVDLFVLTWGGESAQRDPGINLAQNLPNPNPDVKLQVVGSKNYFNRQVFEQFRNETEITAIRSLVVPSQHRWLTNIPLAAFRLTIGHELGHKLGPIFTLKREDIKEKLGTYGDVLEEAKADLQSLYRVKADFLENGVFTEDEAYSCYMAWIQNALPLSQPPQDKAHLWMRLFQFNYFRAKGGIEIVYESGQPQIKLNPERFGEAVEELLTKIIRIQLDGDAGGAQTLVNEYGQWNPEFDKISTIWRRAVKVFKQVEEPWVPRILEWEQQQAA